MFRADGPDGALRRNPIGLCDNRGRSLGFCFPQTGVSLCYPFRH